MFNENTLVQKQKPGKEFRKIIREKLEDAFSSYKESLGKKEFKETMKKASKLLANDFSKKKKKEKKELQQLPEGLLM